jgi:DNA-binding MarR family transcriptional regulator
MSTICSFQPRALLAKVLDGPDTETRRFIADGHRAGRRHAGADHRDDVIAPDGARQFAEARRHPAIQAARRAVLGGIWPGGLAAEAVGQDKGQISRALAGLVSRKLVARTVNPRDNREVLVSLTRSGLAAHDVIVAGALERNQRLLEQLDPDEVATLLAHIDGLTRKAEAMLAVEKELS